MHVYTHVYTNVYSNVYTNVYTYDYRDMYTYGTLAPGLELHVKFVEEFLRNISVSHLLTHSFIVCFGQDLFRSFIPELWAVSCTRN